MFDFDTSTALHRDVAEVARFAWRVPAIFDFTSVADAYLSAVFSSVSSAFDPWIRQALSTQDSNRDTSC